MEKDTIYWSYSELAHQQTEFMHDMGNGVINMDLQGMKQLMKHEKFCPHHVSDLALTIFQYRCIRDGQIRLIAQKEYLEIKNRDC